MDEPAPITRRAWTRRMAEVLGLSRRRIQKLLDAGAPDAADQDVDRDWAAWETTWRQWIATSPRWRSLTRRMSAPMNLDAGHTAAMAAPAGGGDDLASLSILDQEKVRKARADRERSELDLAKAKGEVIPRTAAHAALAGALQVLVGSLHDLPAKVAAEVQPEQRGAVRDAVSRVLDGERTRLHQAIRAEWRRTVPELLTTAIKV